MDDREIAKRAVGFQQAARDYRMMDVPGYMDWSQRKLAEGESDTLIAHLDATSMCLTPADLDAVSESTFEEMLDELKAVIG
jgi:hypothetical protein